MRFALLALIVLAGCSPADDSIYCKSWIVKEQAVSVYPMLLIRPVKHCTEWAVKEGVER
jgi:hypothetical protein